MGRIIRAADLFCGAGGTTAGLEQAAQGLGLDVNLIAVNHWARAMETFARNHPLAEHFCTDLAGLKPSKAVPGGRLDLLVASPECTHHSIARGGKPCDDQSRASAWHVLHWCQELHVRRVIIENVPEFTNWGPLDARGVPMKSRRGDTFRAFLAAMQSLGYRLDWRYLTAADYGDATTRRRFFLLATRGRRRLSWPAASHMAQSPGGLPLGLPAWRPASEVIDWSIPGHSIFLTREDVRKYGVRVQRPLKPNTLRRIEAGIRKFWGEWAEPFLVILRGTRDGQLNGSAIRLDRPLPAMTTCGHIGLVQPVMVSYHGSHAGAVDGDGRHSSVDEPVQTLDCSNRYAVMRPFIVPFFGERAGQAPRSQGTAGPLASVTSHGAGGVVQPFILQAAHGDYAQNYARRSSEMGAPLPTIAGNRGSLALLQPFILNQDQRGRDRQPNEPMITITTRCSHGLVRPFVVKYNRTGGAYEASDPLQTISTDDRYGLVRPVLVEAGGERWWLDILFRMLTVRELAAAHSFPADYWFAGNKSEQVKQIGNSVPVRVARALCREALAG